MNVATTSIGSATIVSAAGELDIVSAPALDDSVVAAIADLGNPIVLDLAEVTFMDSTGLGIVVRALKRCRESGLDFRVVVANDRVRKVFEITGLHTLIDIYDSQDAALEA